MSTVEELESAIKELPTNDYVRLREWFSERDNEQLDNQIEKDSESV